MNDRVIFHADCNGFYASVELIQYPELREKPVAVAGSADERHGIILAKNEAAKIYGVQTAETVWQAKRKCPGLILLPPHHSEYRKYSNIINKIYSKYTDRVEPFGIDESWLDVTGSWQLFGKTPVETATRLKEEVKATTGLTISVGVSFNKVFAKLGSDLKKPDAVTEVSRQNYKTVIWQLPVEAMLYVGKKASERLKETGIQTIGQLANANTQRLEVLLGKQGPQLIRYAAGQDDALVAFFGETEQPKSIGNGLTFKRNLVGQKDIRTGVGSLAEEVAFRLRKHGLYAGSLQVLIKDVNLKSISRQKPLEYATNLSKDLTREAMSLICANWNLAKPIRMLTITAQQLTDYPFAVQTSLFEEAKNINLKHAQLEQSIDKIREKYGWTSILKAGGLHNSIGIETKAETKENGQEEEEEEKQEK